VAPGRLPTGPANAITDVPGIRVGHATVIEDAGIRTGVTAVVHDALLPGGLQPSALPHGALPHGALPHGALPRGGSLSRDSPAGGREPVSSGTLAAGLSVFNGFGKMVGSTQVAELGTIETPVLLTATLSVFRVADALLSYLRDLSYLQEGHGGDPPGTLNPVVAETNDGYLSDIWARPITAEHVRMALDTAAGGPVAEGCVGAGTGTGALGFKAGIGTSSRIVNWATGPVTLGVLVQANFTGELTVLGVPVPATGRQLVPEPPDQGNSCVIVLATDAVLDSRQLERVASRAFAGMARVGSDFSGHSGDYALAISTARPVATAGRAGVGLATEGGPAAAETQTTAAGQAAEGGPAAAETQTTATGQAAVGGTAAAETRAAASGAGTAPAGYPVPGKDLDLLFQAAIEATEEAILNSLFMAVTTTGFRGHVRHAVSLDEVVARVGGRLTQA
jgi:D-aminopeptidase